MKTLHNWKTKKKKVAILLYVSQFSVLAVLKWRKKKTTLEPCQSILAEFSFLWYFDVIKSNSMGMAWMFIFREM